MTDARPDRVHFDHVAIGAARVADVVPLLGAVLGSAPLSGRPSAGVRWASWSYRQGGGLAAIEPRGTHGLRHRFLARSGPPVHRVTFKVPSLAEPGARAEAAGCALVARDESDGEWRVAYLHQASGTNPARPGEVPPGPPDPPPAVAVTGLPLRAPDADRVLTQGASVLGGAEGVAPGTNEPAPETWVFAWSEWSMRSTVDGDPTIAAGPVAIEGAADRDLGLPAGPAPALGATVRQLRAPDARAVGRGSPSA
jgi:hypothetical protein